MSYTVNLLRTQLVVNTDEKKNGITEHIFNTGNFLKVKLPIGWTNKMMLL